MENEKKQELSLWESMKILFGASKAFWLINLVNFGDGVAYFGILTLLTRFLGTRVGMPDQTVSISVSAFTGLVTLFMFGGGFISDRLGVRKAISVSLGSLFIGRFLTTCAPCDGNGFTAYLIAWAGLFFMAAGSGILQPALYAGVKEYTDERTATIGYSFLYAIMNLGIVAESFVSPFVRTGDKFLGNIVGLGWGIDGVFWICTAVTGAMMLIHLTLFSAKVEQTHRLVVDAPHDANAPKLNWKQKMAELPFLDKRFMFFIFILLPVRTLFAHQFLTMPDYVFRAYPEAVSQKFEWIAGLNPFIIVIFVPLIAAFTRKTNIITMMIVGTAISALTTFLLVPGPNLNMLIAYVLLFSLGEAVWSSRFLEYVADLAPAGKVGAYMGLAGIPWFLAKFTTGLYSGKMLEIFVPASGAQDTSTLWLIYGIVACVSPIGLMLGKKWVEVAHKPKNA